MNLLLLTGLYDVKPTSGGSYLIRVYVQEMRKMGHQVEVLYLTSADADPRAATTEANTWYMPDMRDQHYLRQPIVAKVLRRLKAKLQQFGFFKKEGIDFSYATEVLQEFVKTRKIDAVQVDFPWMMPLVSSLPTSIPKVFVSHEAQFVLYKRQGNLVAYEQFKAQEVALAKQYDAVLTLTEVEATYWQQEAPDLKVFCSPMGIAIPHNPLPIAPKATKLVFVGSGNHSPNLDGLAYFIADILPGLLLRHPDARLLVAGMYPETFIKNYAHIPTVSWLGFVPSLDELLQGAICIVPIRQGSGIRVKILESMALGAPVVATTMAAEGIGASDGINILLADDNYAFEQAICQLLENEQVYKQIATNAREFVTGSYDIGATIKNRVACLQNITAPVSNAQ